MLGPQPRRLVSKRQDTFPAPFLPSGDNTRLSSDGKVGADRVTHNEDGFPHKQKQYATAPQSGNAERSHWDLRSVSLFIRTGLRL
jgi:hypothetical protein